MTPYLLALGALGVLHGAAAYAVGVCDRLPQAVVEAAERLLDGGPLLAGIAVGACLLGLDAADVSAYQASACTFGGGCR